jgi:signal transduction histidine kinase
LPEIEEISKSLHESASNVFMLLENLLEWSILRRGLAEFHPVETELKRVVMCGLDPVFESARRKNIELEIDVDESVCIVCDERMTETVFRNLVSNALKYTNKNGKVIVSASPGSEAEVLVSVSDNGIGMSQEIVDRLFLLSEQVNRKGTEGESSSGLGLIICKEFIESQGGKLWVESKEGQGSTFKFTLKHCTQ